MGKNKMLCDCESIHGEAIKQVLAAMLKDEDFSELSDFFKVFGDSTRVKILWALDNAELCVCDIAVLINMTKSAVSHQLGILREKRLVKIRREGKVVYYSLADSHVKEIIEKAVEHLDEQK